MTDRPAECAAPATLCVSRPRTASRPRVTRRPRVARLPALCALALLALGGPAGLCAAERYEGIAYARGTDRIAYRETHWLFDREGVRERLVLYRCADRTPFARKWVREVPSALAPDFDFEDARDGYREGVKSDHGARVVFMRENARAALETRPLPERADAVLDAGFDAFVRLHWQEPGAGRAPRLEFLIPRRFEYLEFALSGVHDTVVDGAPRRQFKMRLAAWYGVAVPGIDLTYDLARRLVEYDGVGNVRDAAGRNQAVRIVFPADAVRSEVPPEEIDQAAAEPLASQCKPGRD
jgi:hypothetical protein